MSVELGEHGPSGPGLRLEPNDGTAHGVAEEKEAWRTLVRPAKVRRPTRPESVEES